MGGWTDHYLDGKAWVAERSHRRWCPQFMPEGHANADRIPQTAYRVHQAAYLIPQTAYHIPHTTYLISQLVHGEKRETVMHKDEGVCKLFYREGVEKLWTRKEVKPAVAEALL